MPNILNFYRAISLDEYLNYQRNGNVFAGREWVEHTLERDHGGFRFADIKTIVDAGGWKEGVTYTQDIPRDVIMKVAGLLDTEFRLPAVHIIPLRYVNVVPIHFSRVQVVYDPRAAILPAPLALDESLVPELHLFKSSFTS